MSKVIGVKGGEVLSECQECKSKKLMSVQLRVEGKDRKMVCKNGLKCFDCGVIYLSE